MIVVSMLPFPAFLSVVIAFLPPPFTDYPSVLSKLDKDEDGQTEPRALRSAAPCLALQ